MDNVVRDRTHRLSGVDLSPNLLKKVPRFESEIVRCEIINRILYLDNGLRRGVNHDIRNIGPTVDHLVAYTLSKDKCYQTLKAKGKRSFDYSQRADARRKLFAVIVNDLVNDGEIFHLNGIWTLKVSTTDDHRRAGRSPRNRAPYFNDHHYHGLPRRDRKRQVAHVA